MRTAALACVLAVVATTTDAAWDALAKLQAKGARITAYAVDLDSGASIQELNAEQRLTPASLTKVVLAAAALQAWSPDHTFDTRVEGSGRFADGNLAGDLIVRSQGDATLDHSGLWLLAAQIRQAGVRRVAGRLLVSAEPFGMVDCETKDRCEAMARSHTAYDAPVAAFGVDYGTWCVDVTGAAPGTPARVMSCAGIEVPIPLTGAIQTTRSKKRTALWLDRVSQPDGDELTMGGDIRSGDDSRLYRAMANPALGAGMLLREMCEELGIFVDGPVVVSEEALPANRTLFAQTESLPLREQLARLLRYSNNYIADVLTLALAATRAPTRSPSLADASARLSEFVARARASVNRPEAGAPRLYSGSGLTPESELSAGDLVAVLQQQYRDAATFPFFYAGLVVPDHAPHAFLRRGSRDWRERVAVKTGTLTEPYSVFGVTGYVRKKQGGWIAFAALSNGTPGRRRHISSRDVLDAIQKDLVGIFWKY